MIWRALATLVLAELLLRVTGLGPWAPFETFQQVPKLSVADPHLGWRNAPGTYTQPTIHIQADGARGHTRDGGTPVELYGGSFAFGFGLDDEDIVGMRLQAARPDLSVRTLAVPGYGTLQSSRLHMQQGHPGATVVYGLVDLHDARNAGARTWLHALDRASHGHAWVATPSAWWDGATLHEREPHAHQHWSWSESSALVHRIELAWLSTQDRLLRTKAETTMQLVARWDAAVEGRFVVAVLHAPDRSPYYTRRLDELGIEWIDLRHPHFPDWAIPGDGHPDARVHADWAEQLAQAL